MTDKALETFGERRFIDGTVLENLSKKDVVLTPRQVEVLYWVARGYTNDEIAEELGISYSAAKNHINMAVLRSGLMPVRHSTRTFLTVWAIHAGLLTDLD